MNSEAEGWQKLDRMLFDVAARLADAEHDEDRQSIGHLCREVLITLANLVHDPARHPPIDDKIPSSTDARRKLEAYIAAELQGDTNAEARAALRAAVALANAIQHRQGATLRDAALCAQATRAVVDFVAIMEGRRPGLGTATSELADRIEATMRATQAGAVGYRSFPVQWLAETLGVSASELEPALKLLERDGRVFYDPRLGMYSLTPMPWN